ncbi:MAG: DoxX family membrane protein [Luteolibacter sp.]
MKIIYQACRGIAAIILLQTLFFKFTGAEESVYIFTKVGAEPFGRVGSGIVELIAAILLFIPRFTWLGAGLAAGVMAGAILSHLTILGVDVKGDGGLLFGLACVVFLCSLFILWTRKSDIPLLGAILSPKLG